MQHWGRLSHQKELLFKPLTLQSGKKNMIDWKKERTQLCRALCFYVPLDHNSKAELFMMLLYFLGNVTATMATGREQQMEGKTDSPVTLHNTTILGRKLLECLLFTVEYLPWQQRV